MMRFFFYGTLSPAFAPPELASLIGRGRLLARGKVRGRLYDLGIYPAAVADPHASTKVSGEVIEFPDDQALVRVLDAYEEFDAEHPGDSLFVRRMVNVELADGRSLPCWAYLYQRDFLDATPIPEGD